MEFDGLIFLSHAFYDYYTGTPQNNLVIIAAHETAHQWWFGLVGNDQALEPWLDEALATYSEILYYEQVYPVLVKWWWDNRVYFHDPQGWVDSTIYATPDFYPYRDAIYLRGALFLNDLRQQIGDQVFMDFLHDYLARYTYRIATGDDFFAVLQEHTSSDLSGLVAQYFQNRP
jgi:aminopeptidase N